MKDTWIWYSPIRIQEQVTLKRMHSSKWIHPHPCVLFFCQCTEDWWASCWNASIRGKRQVISTTEVLLYPGPHPFVIWVTCETEHCSDNNTLSLQILLSCNYASVSKPQLSLPTRLLIPVMLWQWNSKGHPSPHRTSALLWAAFTNESCYSFLLSLHMLSASLEQHPRKSIPIRVGTVCRRRSALTHSQLISKHFWLTRYNSSGWPRGSCLFLTSFF